MLDHLGSDRAGIVGCSMGGGTAFDLALAAPDRVSDLVVEMDKPLLATETRRDELTVPLAPPRSGRIGEISVPILVLVGEHDLPDVRVAAAHLARTFSHHEAIVIPGAAHLASLEQPETFNRALAGFLETFSV